MKRGDLVLLNAEGKAYYDDDERQDIATEPATILSLTEDTAILSLSGNMYEGWDVHRESFNRPAGSSGDIVYVFARMIEPAVPKQDVDDAIASIMKAMSTRGGAK